MNDVQQKISLHTPANIGFHLTPNKQWGIHRSSNMPWIHSFRVHMGYVFFQVEWRNWDK